MVNDSRILQLIKLKKENEKLAQEEMIKGSTINKASPVFLQCIDVTRCNLSCIMCEWHRSPKIKKDKNAQKIMLPRSLLEKVFSEISPKLMYYCPTKMGEPLLSPNFDFIFKWVKDYLLKMEIFTNGVLLNQNIIEKIIPFTSSIFISIDSPKKSTLEKIRVGIKYETLIENIKKIVHFRNNYSLNNPEWEPTKIILHSVLMRSNIEELVELTEFCKSLGVDLFEAYHIYVFDKSYANESLMFHKELANNYLDQAKIRAKQLNMPISFAKKFWLPNNPLPKYELKPCQWLYKYILLEYDGTIRPCPVPDHPIMGNPSKQSIMDIWNNEKYQEYRARVNTNNPPDICKLCGERMHYLGDTIPYDESRFLRY